MTSSSFGDAGRRHELRTACGLPVSRAKLPNCGLDHGTTMLCLVGSQSILAPPEKGRSKVDGDASKSPPDGSVRVWKAAFEETIFGPVQLLELAWLSAAHIILVAEPQREEYQRCHATRRNARNGSENACVDRSGAKRISGQRRRL